jgi:predicted GNAT superfamily acetyltransferase
MSIREDMYAIQGVNTLRKMSRRNRFDPDTSIEVHPIRSLSDLRRCHEIQRAIWGFSDLMVFPYTILISIQHNGGVLLGAYVNDVLVGFVVGYLGMAGAKLYLFSQRMGVMPEFQSLGLGYRLKVAQREQMLRQGIDVVVWTYDPLEGKNATLNIEKLGGIVRCYARDIYGQVQNPLQTGLSTDRFLLEWHLMSDRVRERVRGNYQRPRAEAWLSGEDLPLANYASWESDPPCPLAVDLEIDHDHILVQVPPNLQKIKSYDLGTAQRWRECTQIIFESYFQRGYVVTGFASGLQSRLPNLYRLERLEFPAPIDFSAWADGVSQT